jgi:death-on-curing protein
MMRLLLLQKDFDINANDETKYAFVIRASQGEFTFNQILDWIKEHLKQAGA